MALSYSDLEKEFENLLNDLIKKIDDGAVSGKYEKWDAAALKRLAQNCIDHGDTTNYGPCLAHY